MDKIDIDKLEAGRELDALIAEKVMGWKRINPKTLDRMYQSWETPDGLKLWEMHVPHYSTRISAAWQVVEIMESGEWDWQASNTIPNSDPIVYEWQFVNVGKTGYACEYSIAMAICRAALKALTGGVSA